MALRPPVVIAELSRLRIPDENEMFKRLAKASGLPEERTRALLDKGFRSAARRLLEVCEEAAQSPEGADPLRQSAYVQEADTASARVYGAFATVTGGPEGDIRRATHRIAEQARKEAREYLLQLADTNWDKYVYAVNNELAVAALLGPNGAPFDRKKITVTFYAPDGRWSGTLAPSSSSDAPGLVCGFAHIDVGSSGTWDNAPSGVVAQGFVNLVMNENGAPFRLTTSGRGAEVLAGDFELERLAIRSRGFRAPLVPLPMSTIKHLTFAEMTQDGLRQLSDVLVRDFRYQRTREPKKDSKAGRFIGVDALGYVKWFYPDPFGSKDKEVKRSVAAPDLTFVREGLAPFNATLNDDGYIVTSQGKVLGVRATVKKKRLVVEDASGNSVFTGTPTAAAVRDFVEAFYHWKPIDPQVRLLQIESEVGPEALRHAVRELNAAGYTEATVESLFAKLKASGSERKALTGEWVVPGFRQPTFAFDDLQDDVKRVTGLSFSALAPLWAIVKGHIRLRWAARNYERPTLEELRSWLPR